MGDNRINFQKANEAERARAAALAAKAAEDNKKIPKNIGEEDRKAVKDYNDGQVKALDDDKVVSSNALRDIAKDQGWSTDKLEKTMNRFDEDSDGVFNESEFDKLSAAMQPDAPPTIEVQSGDSLSKIAGDKTGDPSKWKELYAANKDVVGNDPNLIQPGQQLAEPPKWTVDGAKISPDKPGDRDEKEQAELKDIGTLAQAQGALDKIPADDPQRPEYQAKVDQLQTDFDTKWPKPTTPVSTPSSTPASSQPAGGGAPSTPASSTPTSAPASSVPASAPASSTPASEPASSTPATTPASSSPTSGNPPSSTSTTPASSSPTSGNPPSSTSTAPAGQGPAAPDPAGGALLQQMKDHPDQKLTFDQQNQVNTYVKATVDQQMAVANDPSKTPAEQLAAAQSADKTLTDASQAAADSGNNDLAESFAQKYGDAKVGEKLTELKIKTGDPGATEKAIGDAGNDPAKLRAVANALPDSDPRKEALGLIADGKVTGDSARKLLDAMNDQDHTFGELADAIGKSDGNPDVLKAVADVAQYKAKQNADQGNGDTAATMQNLADTMTAISKASDGVRKELSKGFDDSGNFGDFQRAFDSAGSKADVDALKAFVGYTSAQEKAGDRNPSFSHGEADKLQTISDNFDALHANPETWKKVQWAVRDNNDTSRDLRDAAKNTNDPKALEALQTLAKQSGDNDLAVRLEVVRTQYKDLSADAKEKFLKDGHF